MGAAALCWRNWYPPQPTHVLGSQSMVLNLSWILGPFENLRKAMDSKETGCALIRKGWHRVSGVCGKTPETHPSTTQIKV